MKLCVIHSEKRVSKQYRWGTIATNSLSTLFRGYYCGSTLTLIGTDQKHAHFFSPYFNLNRHSWGLLGPQSTVFCQINGMKKLLHPLLTRGVKMTNASLWGPKRPQECLLRLKYGLKKCELIYTALIAIVNKCDPMKASHLGCIINYHLGGGY